MCLGIPGRVVELETEGELRMARVSFGGATRRVCIEHVPDVTIGEYVIVHVGFALSRLDEREAGRIFEFLDAAGLLEESSDEVPG